MVETVGICPGVTAGNATTSGRRSLLTGALGAVRDAGTSDSRSRECGGDRALVEDYCGKCYNLVRICSGTTAGTLYIQPREGGTVWE